jgi:hypothetical protein
MFNKSAQQKCRSITPFIKSGSSHSNPHANLPQIHHTIRQICASCERKEAIAMEKERGTLPYLWAAMEGGGSVRGAGQQGGGRRTAVGGRSSPGGSVAEEQNGEG